MKRQYSAPTKSSHLDHFISQLPSLAPADGELNNILYRKQFGIGLQLEVDKDSAPLKLMLSSEFVRRGPTYDWFSSFRIGQNVLECCFLADTINQLSDLMLAGWRDEDVALLNQPNRTRFVLTKLIGVYGRNGVNSQIVELEPRIKFEATAGPEWVRICLICNGKRFPILVRTKVIAPNLLAQFRSQLPIRKLPTVPINAIVQFVRELSISVVEAIEVNQGIILYTQNSKSTNAKLCMNGFHPTPVFVQLDADSGVSLHIEEVPLPMQVDENQDNGLLNEQQGDAVSGDGLMAGAGKQESGLAEAPEFVDPRQQPVLNEFSEMPVTVSVEFASKTFTLDQVRDWAPGSHISMDLNLTDPVSLRVNGHLVGAGNLVKIGNSIGVQVTNWNLQK